MASGAAGKRRGDETRSTEEAGRGDRRWDEIRSTEETGRALGARYNKMIPTGIAK